MPPEHVRLREAVERFADDPRAVETTHRTPPPELLRELRSRRRRPRRLPAYAGALVASAAVMAIVVGVVLGLRPLLGAGEGSPPIGSEQTTPAPRGLVGAIPTRIDVPGAWIPQDETPGVAAAVVPSERAKLLGGASSDGVAVISAETGAYTWLGLPLGMMDDLVLSLSPDGRRLAYWAGEDRVGAGPDAPDVVTELRVRDLVSGDEVSFEVTDAPQGIVTAPEDLAWVDDTHVVARWSGLEEVGRDGYTASGTSSVVLDAVTARADREVGGPLSAFFDWKDVSTRGAYARASSTRDEVVVLSPDGVVQERLAVPTSPLASSTRLGLNPSGTSFVEASSPFGTSSVDETGDSSSEPDLGTMYVGRALPLGGPAARAEAVEVDGAQVYTLLGWADDDHVVAFGVPGDDRRGATTAGARDGRTAILSIDIRTGTWTEVSRTPMLTGLDFADELWAAPTSERDADASPPDPRRLYGGLLLGAGALGWWTWTRRRRLRSPRGTRVTRVRQ